MSEMVVVVEVATKVTEHSTYRTRGDVELKSLTTKGLARPVTDNVMPLGYWLSLVA